jgi:hydrogenase large subunit
VPCSINTNEVNAINAERLAHVGQLFDDAQRFVEQVYLPDLMAIASFYKDWGAIGSGLSNYMSYGDLPMRGFGDVSSFKFPRGIILNRNLNEVLPVDAKDPMQVQEYVTHSWYDYTSGDLAAKHPWEGETKLHYTGPKPPYEQLEVEQKYSWLKTPRWKNHPMEVGPLARLLVAYASGHEEVKDVVDSALKQLNVPVTALFSTLGRTAARGLETRLIARWAKQFYAQLVANIKAGDTRTANTTKWDPATWPAEAKGVGLSEAPRGALAHWIVIKDRAIENYQLVVPSTWNASPRDAQGQRSAYEASLVGTPVANPDQPLEVLRTVHSFDPCIACAVHIHDEHGRHVHHLNTF